jgi:hypothetical protein
VIFAAILNNFYKVFLISIPDYLLLGVLLEREAVGAELIAAAEDYHVIRTLQINSF